MDTKIDMMLTSEEWIKLRVFEQELQRLNIIGKELVIRAWLEEQIEILKEKFLSLSKKGKMLTVFVTLIVTLIVIDWLF